MGEMSPAEAQERMAKKGTPGVDLLGYNQNAGDMIVLRLRTDTLKGFRPYHDLINTLIHEITHNVWGPHDANFWKLYGELKAQYMKFHRFWSHGGQATSGSTGGQFNGFAGEDDGDKDGPGSFGRVLGGGTSQAIAQEDSRNAAASSTADADIGGEKAGLQVDADDVEMDAVDVESAGQLLGAASTGG